MARRFYTCIIVPDASQRLHKLKISEKALLAAAVVGILSFFVAVSLGFSYVHMAFKASDYDQLQTENTNLRVKTKDLQVSTSKLSAKLNELQTLSEKITKVIEDDPVFKGTKKLNGKPEGGSRVDLTTEQLIASGNLSTGVDLMRNRAKGLEGQYNLLNQLVDQRRTLDAITPNRWPIQGRIRIGSAFGSRTDPFEGGAEMHLGLDIEAPVGSQVTAPATGIIQVAQRESEYGNLIVIDHGNGLTTRFAHLRGFAIKVGQKVTKGQLIGWVGMTGRTTGPHLHYEVRKDDKPVNPRMYLRGD
jgi:murein DD-endopeptidase MepM/ murein hydrolase activator NlpD